MFFWLSVITFVVGILFYGLFPRNDGLRVMDKPEAANIVAPFVAQHMAALQFVKANGYESEVADTTGTTGTYYVPLDDWRNFMPAGMTGNRTNSRLLDPTSMVFCVKNSNSTLTANCAMTTGTTSSDYLVTWATIPGNYPDDYIKNLLPRALGESLFLTDYTREYHLPAVCGVLTNISDAVAPAGTDFQPGSSCAINNTRQRGAFMPTALIGGPFNFTIDDTVSNVSLSCNSSTVVCISRLFAAYDLNAIPPQIIYPTPPQN